MSDRIVLPAEGLVDGPTALRGWRETDVSGLVAACQDPEIPRWLTRLPQPYGEAEARAYLLTRFDHLHAGTGAPFAIVDAGQPDRVLGAITLMRLAWEHRRGEVGYWLAGEARGHGHTTRALRLICAWAFRSLGLERIDLFAASGNVRSQRVAERAGFTREAVLRAYMRGREGQLDAVGFGLLAAEISAR
jgi:RimJ/RimL family protein N-acetyltransferase